MEEWNENSFTEKLILALNHTVRSTAYRSCYILGEKQERTAIVPLTELLHKTNDYFFIGEIIEALGKIGDEMAAPSIVEALQNNSFLVRAKAAAALRNFKNLNGVIEALKAATKDKSLYVRELASASLNDEL
jgi:HEAT repeat protein